MKMSSIIRTDSEGNEKEDVNIHSGHFMMSQLDDEETDSKTCRSTKLDSTSRNFKTYVYGQHRDHSFAIDASLTKLFECMTLAYSGKIASPRWKPFRGTKLTLKDKVRLNNIIWREWTMQYIYLRRSIICQFAAPLCDDVHTKPEAVVLEGKYWKRKLDSVTAEYKKCRKYFKQLVSRRSITNFNNVSVTELLEKVGEVLDTVPAGQQLSPDMLLMGICDEDFSMDLSDSLFTSLNSPFVFPTPKDLYRTGYRDMIQPGLAQLQPNVDCMDTFDPLQDMMTLRQQTSSTDPTLIPCMDQSMDVTGVELMNFSDDLPLIQQTMPSPLYPQASPLLSQESPLLSQQTSSLLLQQASLLSQHPSPILSQQPTPPLLSQQTPPSLLSQQTPPSLLSQKPPTPLLSQTPPPPLLSQQPPRPLLSQQPSPLFSQPPLSLLSQQSSPLLSQQISPPLPLPPLPLVSPQPSLTHPNPNLPLFSQQSSSPLQKQNVALPPRQTAPVLSEHSNRDIINQIVNQRNFPNARHSIPYSIQQMLQTTFSTVAPATQTPERFKAASKIGMNHADLAKLGLLRNDAPQTAGVDPPLRFDKMTTKDPMVLPKNTPPPTPKDDILSQLIAEPASPTPPTTRKQPINRPQKSEPVFVVPKGKPMQRRPRPIAPATSLSQSTPSGNSTCLAQLLKSGTYMGAAAAVKEESNPVASAAAAQLSHLTPILPNIPNLTSAQPNASNLPIILSVPCLSVVSTSQSPTVPGVTLTSPTTKVRRASGEPERKTSGDRVRKSSGDTIAAVKRAAAVAICEVKPLVSQPVSEPTLTTSLPPTVSQAIVDSPSPPAVIDADDMQIFMLTEPGQDGYREQRRVTHISAEKKRRCNIKSGFDVLHLIVPALKHPPQSKVSKALMLHKTADYCRKLKQDRHQGQKEVAALRQEIEMLNSSIIQCQSELPETGVPVTRQRVDKMKDMFDEYVKTRTLQNWKFWIFSIFIRNLFDSFNNTVSTANEEEMYRTVLAWLDQHCSLLHLRPLVLTSLRKLSTTTSILNDPDSVQKQAIDAVSNKKPPDPSMS